MRWYDHIVNAAIALSLTGKYAFWVALAVLGVVSLFILIRDFEFETGPNGTKLAVLRHRKKSE